jgi:hypothetical protein
VSTARHGTDRLNTAAQARRRPAQDETLQHDQAVHQKPT